MSGPGASALLPRRAAIAVFLAFAGTYFFSALLRAVTATLSPVLTEAFSLHARDLGLLAGGYFLGFAAMQLPLGAWLDRHGPRKVTLALLCCAVAGCAAFALAGGFVTLLLGRVLMGMGVAGCLMAPLTGYRRWLPAGAQLRANAWMLMAGSLGTVASTLPVQWLLPVLGWRGLFWGIALLIVLAMGVLALKVPHWTPVAAPVAGTPATFDSGVQTSASQIECPLCLALKRNTPARDGGAGGPLRRMAVLRYRRSVAIMAIRKAGGSPWHGSAQCFSC